MPALPVILSVEGEGAVKSALKNVASDVRGAGNALASATKQGGTLSRVGGRIQGAWSKASGAIRDNPMVAAVGAAGLFAMTDNLIASGDEAEAAGLKLEAMASRLKLPPSALQDIQNLGDEMSKLTGMDDDEFADVNAHLLSFGLNAKQVRGILPGLIGQARTMGQSLTSVADSFGRAYASGNAGALKRSGVVLDEIDLKRIKDLKKAGDYAAAQAATYKAVQESLTKYAIGAAGGLSSSAVARGYFNKTVGDLQEGIGQSAGRARGAWQGAATPIIAGIAGNKTATTVLGTGLEIGTQLAPIFTVMATIGQSVPAWQMLGNVMGKMSGAVTSITEFGPLASTTFNTAKTGLTASGAAATFSGNANAAAALKIRAGAISSTAALGTMAIGLGAVAVAAYGINETLAGIKNATTLSDEELRKKGIMGEIQVEGGNGLAALYGSLTGENQRGLELERQRIALNRRIQARRARHGTETRLTIEHPPTRTERAAASY